MLSSFFKITLRNLYREKMYALINIGGLSLAVVSIFISCMGLFGLAALTTEQRTIYGLQCVERLLKTSNLIPQTVNQ